ncbi:unnamed protein product [Rhizophagus irregularis]|uniref:Uncharacterized protein n=1 Tax=Rhizophagus irregularis TaxID=588596 RepID=A0A915ZK04_9GLOM|nr:unnamed protein product [Rhizophagus irregularis]CAB5380434.1 unnamed protein product [Rhizophagus irregularis]
MKFLLKKFFIIYENARKINKKVRRNISNNFSEAKFDFKIYYIFVYGNFLKLYCNTLEFGFWERTFRNRIIRVIRITVPYMDNIDTDIRSIFSLTRLNFTWILNLDYRYISMNNLDIRI